jgi:hypothetical protein
MSSERIDPQFREAVVTYSWVPSRERGFTQDPVPAERREPTLDATEIHVLDGRDDGNLNFGVRADGRVDDAPVSAAALDLGGKRRSPVTRIVFTTAALSIVAGVGVLAATVGIATISPSRAPAETAAGAPPALAVVEPKEAMEPSSGIREIPLATKKEAAPAEAASVTPKAAEPPVPRSRPDETNTATTVKSSEPAQAKTGPTPAKAALRPSTAPVTPAVATLPPPVTEIVPTLPPPTLPPPATPASAEAGGTDALISDIEARLAKRDASGVPATGPLDPHGMAVAPAGEGPVAILPPPASMAPNYPSPQSSYPGPSSDGATYDLVPPEPVTGNGYGNTYPPPAYPGEAYPPGPVPPADVPYGTPADGAYADPGQPMDYEMIQEKKPGFFKRTWMRTAEAVKDVFTLGRDEEESARN